MDLEGVAIAMCGPYLDFDSNYKNENLQLYKTIRYLNSGWIVDDIKKY